MLYHPGKVFVAHVLDLEWLFSFWTEILRNLDQMLVFYSGNALTSLSTQTSHSGMHYSLLVQCLLSDDTFLYVVKLFSGWHYIPLSSFLLRPCVPVEIFLITDLVSFAKCVCVEKETFNKKSPVLMPLLSQNNNNDTNRIPHQFCHGKNLLLACRLKNNQNWNNLICPI